MLKVLSQSWGIQKTVTHQHLHTKLSNPSLQQRKLVSSRLQMRSNSAVPIGNGGFWALRLWRQMPAGCEQEVERGDLEKKLPYPPWWNPCGSVLHLLMSSWPRGAIVCNTKIFSWSRQDNKLRSASLSLSLALLVCLTLVHVITHKPIKTRMCALLNYLTLDNVGRLTS